MSWSWDEGPLEGFDLETTGTDPETARIVTACYARQDAPGAKADVQVILANPGVPIPEGAAAIHGITTERAQADGIPASEAANWVSVRVAGVPFDPAPLVVYNAPYDLTVADREERRHGVAGLAAERQVIDPLVLDKALDRFRKGSRKLADTCRHYGITLNNAHDATADTLAAIALARALGRAFPQIARMTLDELHAFQVKAKAEQAASFQEHLRRKGSDEVIDPSWPMIPWREPEQAEQEPAVLPVLHPVEATERLLRAALRCLGARHALESANADAESEYADEQLALAARDLFRATEASDRQPVGWRTP